MIGSYLEKARNSKVVSQGFWLVVGLGSSQGIRLIGNLVLTRLLVPEAFGLIALAHAVIIAFEMLSDVGIRNSIIKSDRTHESKFMQTAWTIQFLRGLLLTVMLCALAWPIASFYEEPTLFLILLVLSVNTSLQGSKSVALFLYDKQLLLKRQVFIDILAQLAGITIMIALAYYYRSVWSLVIGALFTTSISLFCSYYFFSGHHSRFRLERGSVAEIISFGKWIFISSIVGYIALHGDKLIFANWMTIGELGIYSIAFVFSSLVSTLAGTFSYRLLDALFKQYLDAGNIKSVVSTRVRLNGIYFLGCLVFSWFGVQIIDLLYDSRYIDAGWMLQLLAIRSFAFCMDTTVTPYLLARGDSFSQMKYQVVSTTLLVLGLVFGAQYGILGLLLAYCLLPAFTHLYLAFLAGKHNLHCTVTDAVFLVSFCFLSVMGWLTLESPLVEKLASI